MHDISILEDAIGAIEADPSTHYQGFWGGRPVEDIFSLDAAKLAIGECGTTGCLAGHIVARNLQDAKFVFFAGQDMTDVVEYTNAQGQRVRGAIHALAEKILGLDTGICMQLFRAENSIDDLKQMAKQIANDGHL